MNASTLVRIRDRRGAALPVALFGLVAVSLLVTTALLTSNTEFAISAAHRGAAASLYNSDAALEQYVADRMAADIPIGQDRFLPSDTAGAVTTVTGPDGRTYNLSVARLSNGATQNVLANGRPVMRSTQVFALAVRPPNGRGRAVGAFVRVNREAARVQTNINAGAVSGGNLSVSGNATISDGRSGTNYCGTENNTAPFSVQVTAGSTITQGGSSTFEGATNVAGFTKEQMADTLLGPGVTLRQLADMATIQFGPRWNKPAYSNTLLQSVLPGDTSSYDWGCPQVLLGTSLVCPLGSSERNVVVAIDATGLNGNTVNINGRYGQGMVIVLNGSLNIQGNFTYKGIILVEKDMFIRGGQQAGQESKIEGSVVSFGASSTVEDNINGTATIKYNRCAIMDAEAALNNGALRNAPQFASSTYAWYELIR